jgi:multidrug efflux pump subunit AcrA (membrane-fusion protein)
VGQTAALRAGDTVKAGQLEARFDSDENIAKNAANDFGLGDCGA